MPCALGSAGAALLSVAEFVTGIGRRTARPVALAAASPGAANAPTRLVGVVGHGAVATPSKAASTEKNVIIAPSSERKVAPRRDKGGSNACAAGYVILR